MELLAQTAEDDDKQGTKVETSNKQSQDSKGEEEILPDFDTVVPADAEGCYILIALVGCMDIEPSYIC